MIEKWSITIPELSGKEERNAYVYVPEAAEQFPEMRFPVLYMFDGHNVFFDEDATYGKSWGMAEFMDATETPMIIAAVECSHSPNNGRLSEYSPYTFRDSQFGSVTGRGKTTMEWMVNTFKPYIDTHYPTMPDREHTFLAGSSMGGLMSLYGVAEYNHVFSRAAALSPSVWVAPRKLDQLLARADFGGDTVVYMDYGSEEMANHPGMIRLFSRVAERLLERRVMLSCRIVPGGQHCEASWEQQLPFVVETLLYGVEIDG